MTDATMTRASLYDRFPDQTCCLVLCRDVTDSAGLRVRNMKAHMAYVETIRDQLQLAGPLYDAAGQTPVGSFYCLATQDPAAARAVVEADPFFRAGVFASVEVHATMLAAGTLVGGQGR